MHIKISDIIMPLDHTVDEVFLQAREKSGIGQSQIISNKLLRRSVDARRGTVRFNYSVLFDVQGNVKLNSFTSIVEKPNQQKYCEKPLLYRPIIIGMGPAGLFAAYYLAKCGCRPIVFDRGGNMDKRVRKTLEFSSGGALDTECNIQFGEGGAGTFSDGKLTTRINDSRCDMVLEIFAEHNAPEEILYLAKPHIGTDKLRDIIVSMRNEIISLGGEIYFDSKLNGISIADNTLKSILINDTEHTSSAVLLATGHSARDTYEMLYKNGVAVSAKPFAVGVRIEHPQDFIDKAQYGAYAGHKMLGAADYRLAYNGNDGSCFSFCMCPGGSVVAAASEEHTVVVNGMSNHSRNGDNANSAIVVSVSEKDFNGVLGGIEFQRKMEKAAFVLGGGGYAAPVQMTSDFLENMTSKKIFGINPSYPIDYQASDLRECLPDFAVKRLQDGLRFFDMKIKGFTKNSVLTGVETRTSAPVRILRNEQMESINVKGLYPIGEGAGYAGGIMSSAVDGIKAAQMLLSRR